MQALIFMKILGGKSKWILVQSELNLDGQQKKLLEQNHPLLSGLKDVARFVRPDTICQCTGLTDKNGILIWESDIIKDLFSDVCAQIKYGSYQSCFDSTKTEHVGFYVGWSGKYTKRYRKDLGYWINMVDAEVVGNAFDNPELCWERNNNGKNY